MSSISHINNEIQNYIGKKFNRLTILECIDPKPGNGKHIMMKCICECGKIINVRLTLIRNGKSPISCGCYAKEKTIKRNLKHGYYGTRLYNIWDGIMNRSNPDRKEAHKIKNKSYFLRGISVCDSWKTFNNFKDWAINNGYKDNLTIERIDVNGNYEPNNCKWIPKNEQYSNLRKNKFYEFNNIKLTQSEWAKKIGITGETLKKRIDKWGLETALTTPAGMKRGWRKHN